MASDRPPFCVETIPGLWEIEPSCLVWSIKFTVDMFATELQDPCGISLERSMELDIFTLQDDDYSCSRSTFWRHTNTAVKLADVARHQPRFQ